jgi:hypothetical protein
MVLFNHFLINISTFFETINYITPLLPVEKYCLQLSVEQKMAKRGRKGRKKTASSVTSEE